MQTLFVVLLLTAGVFAAPGIIQKLTRHSSVPQWNVEPFDEEGLEPERDARFLPVGHEYPSTGVEYHQVQHVSNVKNYEGVDQHPVDVTGRSSVHNNFEYPPGVYSGQAFHGVDDHVNYDQKVGVASRSNVHKPSSHVEVPVVDHHVEYENASVRKSYNHYPSVAPVQSRQGVEHHHDVGKTVDYADVKSRVEAAPVARITQQDMEVNPDGSFYNVWSSDNGISVAEQGVVKHVGDSDVAVSNGEISYTDYEGNTFKIKYVADENGYRVEGDHLPTPPPIPIGILRGLQYAADHPYVETTTFPSSQQQNYYDKSESAPVVVDN